MCGCVSGEKGRRILKYQFFYTHMYAELHSVNSSVDFLRLLITSQKQKPPYVR